MGIKEKLDLLSLSEKERKIAEEKFLAPLSLVTYEELKEIVDYLSSKNVFITKARQIKIVTVSKNDIARNYNILGEIHETKIYEQDPSKISSNAMDIYKRTNYCIQNGMPYKNDGSYKEFLFSEREWRKNLKESKARETATSALDDGVVSITPVIEENNVLEQPVSKDTKKTHIIPFTANLDEGKNMDISDFRKTEVTEPTFNNLAASVEKMNNYLDYDLYQKDTLQQEKDSLKAYQESLASQFVGFDDLDFGDDSSKMGRAA